MAYLTIIKATGKAKCRLCKEPITEGDYSFGVGFNSGGLDRFEQYHMSCVEKMIKEKTKN